jgi:PPOX class probable F420-dependent enzyme
MVFDAGTPADNHALDRLRTDMIGWLTTVTPEGQPQTFPIWFMWSDGELLVYSDRRAKRLGNIRANPRVTLHLDDDGRGNDIVIVEGEARIDPSTPPLTRNDAYLTKYGEWIREELNSPEEMETIYNVPVWIRPMRGRAFGA